MLASVSMLARCVDFSAPLEVRENVDLESNVANVITLSQFLIRRSPKKVFNAKAVFFCFQAGLVWDALGSTVHGFGTST